MSVPRCTVVSHMANEGNIVNASHEELVRTLVVERFTRWLPGPSINDRSDLTATPTTRAGMPFEAIPHETRRPRRPRPVPRRTS